MSPNLIRLTQWFSLVVDSLGVLWFLARVSLKLLPRAKGPGPYQTFLRILGHVALVIGDIESHI